MFFNVIIVIFLCVVVVFFINRRKNKKGTKHQYSNLVDKHNSSISSKRKRSAPLKAINPTNVNDSNSPVLSGLKKITEDVVVPDGFMAFKVLTCEKLDSKQRRIVSEISQSLRKPHPLLLPLTQRNFEANELFDLIKTDVEMTAKVLNAINSPLFGLERPITNINHAIIFMGVGKVKDIVLQCSIKQGMTFTDQNQNEAYNKLWKASYLASSFCLLFAKELNEKKTAELATRCLLSYLGDLAILSYEPKFSLFYLDDFSLFERSKVFQESLGTNTAVVGKFLAQQWQLPTSIETAIEHSILPLTDTMTNSQLSDESLRELLLCYLACRLGDLVAFNGLSEVPEIKDVSFEALGKIEFYYTQNNIQNSGFEKINSVISDPIFRKKLNHIINKQS